MFYFLVIPVDRLALHESSDWKTCNTVTASKNAITVFTSLALKSHSNWKK